MIQYKFDIEKNRSKEILENIINQLFPQKRIIYAMIPDYYDAFLLELSPKFVTIKNILDEKYSFPKTEYILGYAEAEDLSLVYEFYERASVIPFVVASQDIPFSAGREIVDFEKFYDYFKTNLISHLTIGYDQKFLTFYKNEPLQH